MRIAVVLAAALAAAHPSAAPSDGAPGADVATSCAQADAPLCVFRDGPLTVAPDGAPLPGHPHPYHRVLTPLRFTDAAGRDWSVPRRALTDGASIPPLLVPLVGEPRAPEFVAAAALHDAACGAGNEALPQFHARDWEATHVMFHDALLAAGVGRARARVMFAAVYLAGPRWDDPARSLDGVPSERLVQEMEWCLRFIAIADPDRDALIAWMRAREGALIDGTATAPDFAALGTSDAG